MHRVARVSLPFSSSSQIEPGCGTSRNFGAPRGAWFTPHHDATAFDTTLSFPRNPKSVERHVVAQRISPQRINILPRSFSFSLPLFLSDRIIINNLQRCLVKISRNNPRRDRKAGTRLGDDSIIWKSDRVRWIDPARR